MPMQHKVTLHLLSVTIGQTLFHLDRASGQLLLCFAMSVLLLMAVVTANTTANSKIESVVPLLYKRYN